MPSICFGSSKNKHAYTSVGNPRGVPGHSPDATQVCVFETNKKSDVEIPAIVVPALQLSGTFPRKTQFVKTWGNKNKTMSAKDGVSSRCSYTKGMAEKRS